MGGSGSTSQTTTTQLPSWAQPYATSLLQAGFGQALPGGQPGASPLPYSQVAPFTQDQTQGFDATRQAAQNVGGLANEYGNFVRNSLSPDYMSGYMGEGYLNDVIGGKYLTPESNPHLKDYYNAAAAPLIQQYTQSTSPEVLRQAIQSGTTYSSGTAQGYANAQQGLAHGLSNLGASIYAPAYQQERQHQQNAAQLGQNFALGREQMRQNLGSQFPNVMSAQFAPGQALGAIGTQQQQQAQQILNQGYQNAYNQGQWPYQALGQAGSYIGAATGGQGTVRVDGGGGSMK